MSSFKFIEVSVRDGVQVIKMNRPEKKNAINLEMYKEIPRAMRYAADDDSVVLTVLTGAGDYYSSGNDLAGYQNAFMENIEESARLAADQIESYVRNFIEFPKILVALVNGPSIGIAVTTLGLCDLVLASDKAAQMLYFGRQLTAAEAKEYGLVSQIFPHSQLDKAWDEIYRLAKLPPQSLVYSKQAVRSHEKAALYEANRAECERLKERWTSEESVNAVMKFFNRRNKM